MDFVTIDKLGVRVSRLGFGCMRFPTTPEGGIDEPRALKMIDTAYKAGVNYFDTAYFYHGKKSEEFTGRATKEPDSSELAEIAGKYGFTQGLNPDIRELAEDKRSECEEEGDMEQEAYFSSILEAMSIE